MAELDSGGAAESGGRSTGAACLEWRCWAGGSAKAATGAALGVKHGSCGEWRRAGAAQAAPTTGRMRMEEFGGRRRCVAAAASGEGKVRVVLG